MALQTRADHNIVSVPCGYMNAWFCYTLKGDTNAAQVFMGKEEIRNNTSRWQDVEIRY